MFKKALGSAVILLALAVLYLVYYSFYILPKDVARYEKYLKDVQETPHKQKAPTYQSRENVIKDIWHLHHGQRLHYQIRATSSMLMLIPEGNSFSLREHLQCIDCLLQEKLYTNHDHQPMQHVRALHADEGIYDFSNHQFSAEKIHLYLYALSDHSLPHKILKSPFLKGHANNILLTLSSTKGPTFHAEKFVASMDIDNR